MTITRENRWFIEASDPIAALVNRPGLIASLVNREFKVVCTLSDYEKPGCLGVVRGLLFDSRDGWRVLIEEGDTLSETSGMYAEVALGEFLTCCEPVGLFSHIVSAGEPANDD